MAPLVWVPWVPENPSIFQLWVPELINFGKKEIKFNPFSSIINLDNIQHVMFHHSFYSCFLDFIFCYILYIYKRVFVFQLSWFYIYVIYKFIFRMTSSANNDLNQFYCYVIVIIDFSILPIEMKIYCTLSTLLFITILMFVTTLSVNQTLLSL